MKLHFVSTPLVENGIVVLAPRLNKTYNAVLKLLCNSFCILSTTEQQEALCHFSLRGQLSRFNLLRIFMKT